MTEISCSSMPTAPPDPVIGAACRQIVQSVQDGLCPVVQSFFDRQTHTVSHVAFDPDSKQAAVIDCVLDYDAASGRTSTGNAAMIVEWVRQNGLSVQWLIETHVHADHLSAAPWVHGQLGGTLMIGEHIRTVQNTFGDIFNEGDSFARDGSQFGRLIGDGEGFALGRIPAMTLHVPGHTPADMAFIIGNTVFIGDTLFMPDYGTARADFPGGDARTLYRSIRRLLSLPAESRLFLCHDYKPPDRNHFAWETTVAAQRAHNIHVHDGVDEESFVAMREARDATLDLPDLIIPSVQVNMRGGRLPEPEKNGVRYLKVPVNLL
ncbi:Zn-dependent hydrolase, glyoxalase II family [Granulibacter bethesdensis]|nr:Zn-dependent hydrolase, glyoxalase II family [Granulibacter bethesdensis]